MAGKAPTAGKKTKASIAKAATSRKGAKKKWTKGKVKDKIDNLCVIEKQVLDSYAKNIDKVGRLVSISTFSHQFKVNGSVARAVMRMLAEKKIIKPISLHGKQWIYTQTQEIVKKKVEEKDAKKGAKGAKAAKK